MIVGILSRLLHLFDQGLSSEEDIPVSFALDHFLEELSELRSSEVSALEERFLASGPVAAELAREGARLARVTPAMQLDPRGTGKVVLGSPGGRTVTFHFREGRSTGLKSVSDPAWGRSLPEENDALPRRVKLLLVNLPSPEYPLITSPLGIITLGGYARRTFGAGIDVSYIDLQLESLGDFGQRIERELPDVVGFSVKTGAHDVLMETMEVLRDRRAVCDPLVVLGNVVPTYAADELLHRLPEAICVVGRGEPALRSLIRHVAQSAGRHDLTRVPNIAFLAGTTILQTGGVHFDLEDLGLPDWDVLFERYGLHRYQEIWMEASRGCPQKRNNLGCSFCAILPNNESRDWIPRSVEAVLQEIRVLSRLGVKHIRFADEEFMASRPLWALDLARRFVALRHEIAFAGLEMPTFDFATRVDDVFRRGGRDARPQWDDGSGSLQSSNDVRREALATFKEAGLTQVYLGLESGATAQLKRMYKAVTPEDNRRAIEILSALDIQIAGGWIMIDPLMEHLDELDENIAFLETNGLIPETLADNFATNPINRLRILEGSPLVDIMNAKGLLGEKKPNLVEYRFHYQSPLIARIVDELSRWEDETGPFVYALKSSVANGVLNAESDDQVNRRARYFFLLKRLDLEFLKAILGAARKLSSGLEDAVLGDSIRQEFGRRRDAILLELSAELASGSLTDAAGTLVAGLRLAGRHPFLPEQEDLAA